MTAACCHTQGLTRVDRDITFGNQDNQPAAAAAVTAGICAVRSDIGVNGDIAAAQKLDDPAAQPRVVSTWPDWRRQSFTPKRRQHRPQVYPWAACRRREASPRLAVLLIDRHGLADGHIASRPVCPVACCCQRPGLRQSGSIGIRIGQVRNCSIRTCPPHSRVNAALPHVSECYLFCGWSAVRVIRYQQQVICRDGCRRSVLRILFTH
jgi:hypothetical protein